MATIQQTVRVAAPLDTTFDAFTLFESYPEFAKSIEQVRRERDAPDIVHWRLALGSMVRESVTKIHADREAHRVEWHGVEGTRLHGHASMREVDDGVTELTVAMTFLPHGAIEHLGDRAGAVRLRFRRDLRRFATYLESGGMASPAGRRVAETATPDDQPRDYGEKITEKLFGEDQTG